MYIRKHIYMHTGIHVCMYKHIAYKRQGSAIRNPNDLVGYNFVPSQVEVPNEYDAELEGPGYSPAGGQGSIPKDTTNTYIIPGMDAMSPEEYQAALQKSIIDRQAKRKETGLYGNRNTWDYLNNLSGDTGVLKKDPLEDN